MWPNLPKPFLWAHKVTVSPIFDGYMLRQIIQVCTIANISSVCLCPGWFLRPVRYQWVLQWSLNGCILSGLVGSQLGIATWLAGDICHWFGYILWYICMWSSCHESEPLKLYGYPSPPTTVLVVLTSPENKLSKMMGHSTSCPCKSWSTEVT